MPCCLIICAWLCVNDLAETWRYRMTSLLCHRPMILMTLQLTPLRSNAIAPLARRLRAEISVLTRLVEGRSSSTALRRAVVMALLLSVRQQPLLLWALSGVSRGAL